MATYTSEKEFEDAYTTLFQTFATGKTKSLAWRKWQLKQVWWMIVDNEKEILAALKTDLNRHEFEAHGSDLLGMKQDTLDHIQHLEEWAADEIPDAGIIFGTLGKARIRKEPLGVALIIGAWNFPFLLLLQPMLAAIAAGCCVMLKPSELAEASQALLVSLVPKYLDQSAIRLVTGGPAETGKILEHRFDHIFFTGSGKVAKYITAAAAKFLTPTVLELGGQGPAIVTSSANVDLAAKRIAYGKFLNAGQICLSINHVFVDPSVYDTFVDRLGFWFDKYLNNAEEGYCRIINDRNFNRLNDLLGKTNGKITFGGKSEPKTRFFEPTVVRDVKLEDSLMEEELFGPILPVIKATYVQAYKTISSMEHPLAIYIFSKDQKVIDEILANTNSGGVTINDVLMHAGVPNAPFGGVGPSGHGSYHGVYGFKAFSHERIVVAPPTWLDRVLSFRYPPYDLSNVGKIAVSNKLGFKRGEGLLDQKIKSRGLGKVFMGSLQAAMATIVLVALARLIADRKLVLEDAKSVLSRVIRDSGGRGL